MCRALTSWPTLAALLALATGMAFRHAPNGVYQAVAVASVSGWGVIFDARSALDVGNSAWPPTKLLWRAEIGERSF